jgi:hypothetical protein
MEATVCGAAMSLFQGRQRALWPADYQLYNDQQSAWIGSLAGRAPSPGALNTIYHGGDFEIASHRAQAAGSWKVFDHESMQHRRNMVPITT